MTALLESFKGCTHIHTHTQSKGKVSSCLQAVSPTQRITGVPGTT